MIKLEKKHIKIYITILKHDTGNTQMGGLMGGTASAASSSIGVVDFRQIMGQSSDVQDANTKMQLAVEEARQDFESKTAGMSDEEKQNYYQQSQEKLARKQQELFDPIQK